MLPNLFIYGLVDGRDGRVRYVGKSATGMRRPIAHAAEARRKMSEAAKRRWAEMPPEEKFERQSRAALARHYQDAVRRSS